MFNGTRAAFGRRRCPELFARLVSCRFDQQRNGVCFARILPRPKVPGIRSKSVAGNRVVYYVRVGPTGLPFAVWSVADTDVMCTLKRVLKTLTYEEKAAAIREVEKGLKTKSSIAKEFGIPLNTLSTYLKNRDTILSKLATSGGKNRKRARRPENPDVDERVLKWFKQSREKKVPLSGLLIKAKAEEFALQLEKHNFKASNGWLDGFKERNGICFKTASGKSCNVNSNGWQINSQQTVKDRNLKSVFNADLVNVDNKSAVCGDSTDAGILTSLANNVYHSSDEDEYTEHPIPTSAQAQVHYHELRRFIENQQEVSDELILALDKIKRFTAHAVMKNTNILT